MAGIFWSAIGFAWEKIYEAIVDRDFPNQTNVNNITINNTNVVVINHPPHLRRIVHAKTGAVRSKNKNKTTSAVTSSHTSQKTRGKSIMSLQDASTLSSSPRSIAHTTTDTIISSYSSSQTTGKSIMFAQHLSSLARGYSSPSTSSNLPWEKGAPSKKTIEILSNASISRSYLPPSISFNLPREEGAPSKKITKELSNMGVSRGFLSPSTFSNLPKEKGVPSEKIIKKPTKLGSRLPPPPPTRLKRRMHLQNYYSLSSNQNTLYLLQPATWEKGAP